ncbi:MAG: hypothetical protein HDT19_00840 [Oscillibacter sp.]|nr:hypothetical protein [Oscillibacter sp.]
MKLWFRRHKKAAYLGLLILAEAWCLWYSRPVDIHFLMGNQKAAYMSASIWPQSDFPNLTQKNLDFTAGTLEMEALTKRLEALRFHRSPLEPLLRVFPSGNRASVVDPEQDYHIYLAAYTEDYGLLTQIEFSIDQWSYGPAASLPLYLSRGQEQGRELGAFLWEITQKSDSNS